MKKLRKYPAFSTVETIVAAVILSLMLILFYSAIGNTLDADHSVLISKGTSASERYKAEMCKAESEVSEFPGGRLYIDQKPVNQNLILLHFTIKDQHNTNILEWEEYVHSCKN